MGKSTINVINVGEGRYCGWLRNPAPVENGGKHPTIYRVSTILLVVQDFFHPQYRGINVMNVGKEDKCENITDKSEGNITFIPWQWEKEDIME